jgi:hypothetical protein
MPVTYENLTSGLRVSDNLARIFDYSTELCAITPDIHDVSLSYSSVLLCFTVAPDDLCVRFREFAKNVDLGAIARYAKFDLADVAAVAKKLGQPAGQRSREGENLWGENFSLVFEDAVNIAKLSGLREVGVRHLMAAYVYDTDPARRKNLLSWKLDQEEWATWFLQQMQALRPGEFTEWLELDKTRKKPVAARPSSRRSTDWLTEADIESFSPQARRIINRADQVRQSYGLKMIHNLDLLRALAEITGGQLAALLTEAGIGLNDFFSTLEARAKRALVVEEPVEQPPTELRGLPRLSRNARRALVAARDKAAESGSKTIEESHILFGVLAQKGTVTLRELNNRGITSDKVKLSGAPLSPTPRPALAGYQSDDPIGDDLLDITKEVNALASVLAAKDVGPPLALGLFGEWGSGKSFFMSRLESRIRALQECAQEAQKDGIETAYCEHIVQLTFNAWNYIDTNLWASLAAEIFERLAAALAKRRGGDSQEERALVLAAASSSQAVLAEAERKKAAAEEELKQKQQQLETLQRSENTIEASLSPKELFEQAYRFAIAQEEVRKPLEEAAKTLHLAEATAAAGQIKSQILELRGFWSTLAFTIRHNRTLLIWLVALLSALALAGGVDYLLQDSHLIGAVIGEVIAFLGSVSIALAPLAKGARKAMQFIQEAKKSKQELINKKKQEKTRELEAQYREVQEEVRNANEAVTAAANKLDQLNRQLANMRSDRTMADYIRQRNESNDYTKHLGVIARVRSDFQHLSTLLREVKQESEADIREMKKRQAEKEEERRKAKYEQRKAQEKEANGPPQEAAGAPAVKDENSEDTEDKLFPRIDRIILYIDDLDRCPAKNVVEVLQAVHLLLAFPLFIVVVGVDPRWLLRSLERQSCVFTADEEKNGSRAEDDEDPLWRSTPMNYLEKIFQIPFTLRPINRTGFGNLVEKFAASRAEKIVVQMAVPAEANATKDLALAAAAGTSASTVAAAHASAATGGQQPEAISAATSVGTAAAEPAPKTETASTVPAGDPSPAPPGIDRNIDRNPEHLRIEEWERTFMKTLSELIPSPRAAKRFINIYRLMRASVDDSERTKFVGDLNAGEYQAAQMLLAILTRYPAEASVILQKLIKDQPLGTWGDFKKRTLAEAAAARPGKTKQSPASRSGSKRSSSPRDAEIAEPLPIHRWLELFAKLDRIPNNLDDRPAADFKKWAARVARYSFQSGRVLLFDRD